MGVPGAGRCCRRRQAAKEPKCMPAACVLIPPTACSLVQPARPPASHPLADLGAHAAEEDVEDLGTLEQRQHNGRQLYRRGGRCWEGCSEAGVRACGSSSSTAMVSTGAALRCSIQQEG